MNNRNIDINDLDLNKYALELEKQLNFSNQQNSHDVLNSQYLQYSQALSHQNISEDLAERSQRYRAYLSQLLTLLDYAVAQDATEQIAALITGEDPTLQVDPADPLQLQLIHRFVINNNLKMVTALINSIPQLLEQKDFYGRTPLLLAAFGGHTQIVEYLLSKGADIKATTDTSKIIDRKNDVHRHHGETALHWAFKYNYHEIVATLVKNGANTTLTVEPQNSESLPFIFQAIFDNNLEMVKALLENAPKSEKLLEQKNVFGFTPLLWAVMMGNAEIVKYFLDKKANPNIAVCDNTALHWAFDNNHHKIVAELVAHGANATLSADSKNPKEKPFLHKAAETGNLNMVKALLENAPELLKQKDQNDHTPIIVAAACGHIPVVKYLLTKNPDMCVSLKSGASKESILQLESVRKHDEVVNILCKYICEYPDTAGIVLLQATEYGGDLKIVKALLENAPGLVEQKDQTGQKLGKTALKLALEHEHDAVADILSIYTDIKLAGSALLESAKKGDLGMIKGLLEKWPELLEQKDQYDQTPTLLAAANGHIRVVEYLLTKKPNLCVSTKDKSNRKEGPNHGKTVLRWASECKHDEVLNILCKYILCEFADEAGPILRKAIRNGDLKIVKALLENAPELLEQKDSYDQTPILLAAAFGKTQVVKYLLTKKPDLTVFTKDISNGKKGPNHGKTALDWSLESKHNEITVKLVKHGAKATFSEIPQCPQSLVLPVYQTPLLMTTLTDHKEMVEYLLHNQIIKKNTNGIIEMCEDVFRQYEASCKKFFGSPGEEGIKRKKEFLHIITTINENTSPEEAFIKLYQFYKKYESIDSRLIKPLEKNLAGLVGIEIPDKGHLHLYNRAIGQFRETANSIENRHEKYEQEVTYKSNN